MYNPYPYIFAPNIAQISPSVATNPLNIFSKLKLSSILNGTQKALNFANQAIPLYKEVKPIINNVKTLGKLSREFNKINKVENNNANININKNNNISNNVQFNRQNNIPVPKFFI